MKKFNNGDRVRHEDWGTGTVVGYSKELVLFDDDNKENPDDGTLLFCEDELELIV